MAQHGELWVRRYAGAVGISFLLAAVAGFLIEGRGFGVLNSDLAEDLLHTLTAALLIYVGFVERRGEVVRRVVAGQGIVYVLIGLLGFAAPMLFGLLPSGYSALDNAIHLVEGVVSVGIVWLLSPARL